MGGPRVNANSGTSITKKKTWRNIFSLGLPVTLTLFFPLLHFHLSPIALLPPHLFLLSGQSSLILFRGILRKTFL